MPSVENCEIEGFKTFFVVPDLSLFSEDFLESLFLRGFESYVLVDDRYLSLPAKIATLIDLFPNTLFFVNIQRKIEGLDWEAVLRDLKTSGPAARFGVLYSAHLGAEYRSRVEDTYLYDIGIDGGCVPLEFSKQKNLLRITKTLIANEATGRRKQIRALCGSSCLLNFHREGRAVRGKILDISISHLSCQLDDPAQGLDLYEKLLDVQIRLEGILCFVDAVVALQRVVQGSTVFVLLFRHRSGRDGLEPDARAKVSSFVFTHYNKVVHSLMKKAFSDERLQLKAN